MRMVGILELRLSVVRSSSTALDPSNVTNRSRSIIVAACSVVIHGS